MPVLSKGPADLRNFVMETISAYHPRLTEAGVTIGVLVADPTERDMNAGEAPFLKLHGYPCYAVVAITPAKQRVLGIPDATITIDGEAWKGLDDDERAALIDHEATHLELVRNRDDQLVCDDHGRPKLKMRLHDVIVGGFRDNIRRHGAKSIEGQQLNALFVEYRQKLMSFCSDVDPQDERPSAPFAVVA